MAECLGEPAFAQEEVEKEKSLLELERRRLAEEWCDRFEANNDKWLKSTIATLDGEEPVLTYEEVDTSLESAPFMGAPVFKMEMRITVPKAVAVKKLRACLEELAGELNCDIDLEPA